MANIVPEVKRLHSPDVYDLSTFVPKDPGNFGILVQVIVGPAGSPGEESIDVVVCTSQWFDARLGPADVVMGRSHVFVKQYDHARLVRFIGDFVATCSGTTWTEVGLRLSRLGTWEFEDYDDRQDLGG